jgi:hypothetical protein
VNANAPAHAVAYDRAAFSIDIGSCCQITPGPVKDLDKLPVGGFLLRLVDAVGYAEHLIQIRHDRCVAELGEVANVNLHITSAAIVMVHDQHAGSRSLRSGWAR